jgi:hypothetical protein
VTIWYTVTEHEGQEIISVQHVSLDTLHASGLGSELGRAEVGQ